MTTTQTVQNAGTLLGSKVRDTEGNVIGKMEDFVIDLEAGRIAYGVFSFGGFLGFGERWFAIPWPALELDDDVDSFVLNVTKEQLENAPSFEKSDPPSADDREYVHGIYDHYGYRGFW